MTTTNSPGSDSPAAGAPTIAVTQFNEQESPEHVIARLAKEQRVDMLIPFDCADPKVPFAVRGYFVVPDKGLFKWVGDERPA